MASQEMAHQLKLPDIHPSWLEALGGEFEQDYMLNLKSFLQSRYAAQAKIYPKGADYFKALNLTPLGHVKVVILGQDPYHNPDQAHGLSFSVPEAMPVPPSLKNIYKEIQNNFGGSLPTSGNLEGWAKQGVLLLNAVLTVEENTPGAHQGKGWELFTDRIISTLNKQADGTVFMLWGRYAQSKKTLIDGAKHCVLEAPHPSPLSAHRGFFGCHHFKKANDYLVSHGKIPIEWGTKS